MRQRMATYIAGGGLPPLIGEWSFITGAPRIWGRAPGSRVEPLDPLAAKVANTSAKPFYIKLLKSKADPVDVSRLLTVSHDSAFVTSGPVKSGQTAFPDCVGNATDAKAQVFSAYYNAQKAAYLQPGSAGVDLATSATTRASAMPLTLGLKVICLTKAGACGGLQRISRRLHRSGALAQAGSSGPCA